MWLLSCAELWVPLSSHWLPLLKYPTLPFVGSTALRKGSRRYWLHWHNYDHTLTLTSPWWWSCEHYNDDFLFSFWLPLFAQLEQHGHHVIWINWNEPKASCVELYNSIWLKFEHVNASRVCLVIHKVQVRPATRSPVATRKHSTKIMKKLTSVWSGPVSHILQWSLLNSSWQQSSPNIHTRFWSWVILFIRQGPTTVGICRYNTKPSS